MSRCAASLAVLVAVVSCATVQEAQDGTGADSSRCHPATCTTSCVAAGWTGGDCLDGTCRCSGVPADGDTETYDDAGVPPDAETTGETGGEADGEVADRPDAEVDVEARDDATEARDDATEARDDAADVPDVPVVCGDGTVAGTEQCDDGNTAPGDGCSPTCMLEYCGDGVVGTSAGLFADFESTAWAGVGWTSGVPYGFAPTGAHARRGTFSLAPQNMGMNSTTASVSLRAPIDGRLCFWYAGESESGYDYFRFAVDGTVLLDLSGTYDTWTQFCTSVAAGTHDLLWTYQKDGSVSDGWDTFYIDDVSLPYPLVEECDDGNTTGGDGCSARCTIEVCGNGVVDVGEQCDDGNVAPLDGCSGTCTLEYCGDGVVGTIPPVGDDFESGGLGRLPWVPATPYGFAATTAHVHGGTHALGPQNRAVESSTGSIALHAVSDGHACFWWAGESESCCDHFRFAVDGTTLLQREGSFTTWTQFCADVTPGAHDFAWSYQKDGSDDIGWDAYYIDDVSLTAGGAEECDDGNTVGGDGCGPECTIEICGNGVLDTGEQCDDGNLESTDACSASCHFSACGDRNVNWSSPGDGFETGDLTQLPWSTGAAHADWAPLAATAAAHAGTYGLVSQNDGRASTTSWAEVPLTTAAAGQVCFWYTGQSEPGYDYFDFLRDGTSLLHVAGTVAWTNVCFPVATAGAHTFRWQYSKDGSGDTGQDRFAIDDATFPPVVETCDDGDTVPGDGCNANCQTE